MDIKLRVFSDNNLIDLGTRTKILFMPIEYYGPNDESYRYLLIPDPASGNKGAAIEYVKHDATKPIYETTIKVNYPSKVNLSLFQIQAFKPNAENKNDDIQVVPCLQYT